MFLKSCVRLLPVISQNIINNRSYLLQRDVSKVWTLSTCNLSRNSKHYTTDTTESKITTNKLNDNSNNIRQNIYYGILTKQIKTVKIFSLSTSLMGLIAQPIIYNELSHTHSVPLIIGMCSFVGFFTFITPVLLHFVTKKYVTHLDYKPDTKTYVASILNFFCRTKEIEFKIEDVKVPDVPGMFTSFIVNGTPLFLDPRLFDDPSHYAKIMGYDKPIDYKLYQTSESKKS